MNFNKILYFLFWLTLKFACQWYKCQCFVDPCFIFFILLEFNCGKKACRPNWVFHSPYCGVGLMPLHWVMRSSQLFLHLLAKKKKKKALSWSIHNSYFDCVNRWVRSYLLYRWRPGNWTGDCFKLACSYANITTSDCWRRRKIAADAYVGQIFSLACILSITYLRLKFLDQLQTWVVYHLPTNFKEVCFRLLWTNPRRETETRGQILWWLACRTNVVIFWASHVLQGNKM